MNQLRPDNIPEKAFKKASALVLSSYLVHGKPNNPMKDSALKAIEYAKKYDVPVVLTLGTKYVIEDRREWWIDFLKEHVTCVAMNEEEGEALTGEKIHFLQQIRHLNGLILFFVPQALLVYIWQATLMTN